MVKQFLNTYEDRNTSQRRRKVMLCGAMLTVLVLTACSSAPKPASSAPADTASGPHYSARPTIATPSFKVFHHDASTFTLVTKDNATDGEIEAIIWQIRDDAHAHSLDKLGISQKAIDEHKPTAWFHIYRGTKCASEKYASGEPPCGGSYHAAGDYTFGSSVNANWDDGILRNAEGQELPLWDSEAPYKP